MGLLLHDVYVLIFVSIYIPAILSQMIYLTKAKGIMENLYSTAIIIALTINIPPVFKYYQQHIMGHFSGLQELVHKNVFTCNMIFIVSVIIIIFMIIMVARSKKE